MSTEAFETRVLRYIENNYEVPKTMRFYHDGTEWDLSDFVDAYVEAYNDNLSEPFDDDADDYDVAAVGDEILDILTSEAQYRSGDWWIVNDPEE